VNLLRTFRKLLLGETWVLPVGIAVLLLGSGLVLRPLDETLWHDAGGAVLAIVVIALLVWAIARGARPRKR